MIVLSLGTLLVNMQGRLLEGINIALPAHPATLSGLLFFLGAGGVFSLLTLSHIDLAARAVSAFSAIVFCLWLILPSGPLSLGMAVFMVLGLGCCAAIAVYAYTRCLNAMERFLGIAVTALMNVLFQFIYIIWIPSSGIDKVSLFLLIVITLLCLQAYRREDFEQRAVEAARKTGMALAQMLFFYLAHMFFEIAYAFLLLMATHEVLLLTAATGLAVILLSLALYFKAKIGVWHMSSLYLLSMAAALISLTFYKGP